MSNEQQQPATERCGECGHSDGVDEKGVCLSTDYSPDSVSCLCHGCLCKCAAAVGVTAAPGGGKRESAAEAELASIKEIMGWFIKKIDAINLSGDTPADVMTAFQEIVSTCKRAAGMARLAQPASADHETPVAATTAAEGQQIDLTCPANRGTADGRWYVCTVPLKVETIIVKRAHEGPHDFIHHEKPKLSLPSSEYWQVLERD